MSKYPSDIKSSDFQVNFFIICLLFIDGFAKYSSPNKETFIRLF
jgi:hypothetical protein